MNENVGWCSGLHVHFRLNLMPNLDRMGHIDTVMSNWGVN